MSAPLTNMTHVPLVDLRAFDRVFDTARKQRRAFRTSDPLSALAGAWQNAEELTDDPHLHCDHARGICAARPCRITDGA
jgi:hypothetical protein